MILQYRSPFGRQGERSIPGRGVSPARITTAAAGRQRRSVALGSASMASGSSATPKFMSPERFLANLRSSARLHIPLIPEVISHQMPGPDSSRARRIWEEMQTAGITIFEFSPGGDAVMSIGWSATDKQFYNLLECC